MLKTVIMIIIVVAKASYRYIWGDDFQVSGEDDTTTVFKLTFIHETSASVCLRLTK